MLITDYVPTLDHAQTLHLTKNPAFPAAKISAFSSLSRYKNFSIFEHFTLQKFQHFRAFHSAKNSAFSSISFAKNVSIFKHFTLDQVRSVHILIHDIDMRKWFKQNNDLIANSQDWNEFVRRWCSRDGVERTAMRSIVWRGT